MSILGGRCPLALQESTVHWHWEKDAEIRKDVEVVCECVKVYTVVLEQVIQGCDSKGVLMNESELSLGELAERPVWFKRPCLV